MNVNLVLVKKDGTRRVFPLPSSVTIIGRRADCDLYAPLMSVSKRHCQLNCDKGALRIRDLGSRNGTYLNGKRINEAEIKAGDRIRIGPLTFVFQIDGGPENMGASKASQQSSQRRASREDLVDEMLDALEDEEDLALAESEESPQKDAAEKDFVDEVLEAFEDVEELDSLEDSDSP
ncbi:MAG TPA: FHA domain-containing protein [Sedimentisphaerales bacterium]|nr:FHA domain-containing protein [Sedimentisphaerales bacterium]